MSRLYADENFKICGRRAPSIAKRAVLTFNRRHFIRWHKQTPTHAGIIVCTDDDATAFVNRIDQTLVACPVLDNQLIRIVRPS